MRSKAISPAPSASAAPSVTSEAQPSPAGTPAMTEQAPFVPAPEVERKKIENTDEADARERAKFYEVKAKAADNKRLQELKEKIDSAANDEEARKATRDYYRALFAKMRKMDSSIKDRVDRMEAATMKRIDEGKPVAD